MYDWLSDNKTYLVIALVFANVLVIVGVFLEYECFPERIKNLGWRILMVGLSFEPTIAVLIVLADNNITNRIVFDLSSRALSTSQQIIISNIMNKDNNFPDLNIMSANDPEAKNYGTFIGLSFDKLAEQKKLTSGTFPLDSTLGFFATGVTLFSYDAEHDPISKAIKEAKIGGVIDMSIIAEGKKFFGFPRTSDTLVVGRKPPSTPYGWTQETRPPLPN